MAGELGTLYVDATGALAALDMFRAAELPLAVRGVLFNHGDRRGTDGTEVKLGKSYLVN